MGKLGREPKSKTTNVQYTFYYSFRRDVRSKSSSGFVAENCLFSTKVSRRPRRTNETLDLHCNVNGTSKGKEEIDIGVPEHLTIKEKGYQTFSISVQFKW